MGQEAVVGAVLAQQARQRVEQGGAERLRARGLGPRRRREEEAQEHVHQTRGLGRLRADVVAAEHVDPGAPVLEQRARVVAEVEERVRRERRERERAVVAEDRRLDEAAEVVERLRAVAAGARDVEVLVLEREAEARGAQLGRRVLVDDLRIHFIRDVGDVVLAQI